MLLGYLPCSGVGERWSGIYLRGPAVVTSWQEAGRAGSLSALSPSHALLIFPGGCCFSRGYKTLLPADRCGVCGWLLSQALVIGSLFWLNESSP